MHRIVIIYLIKSILRQANPLWCWHVCFLICPPPSGACLEVLVGIIEKVASDLGLGGGFRRVLLFPPLLLYWLVTI